MKLLTFPGQGTSISISILKAIIRNKSREFQTILSQNGKESNDLLQYIFQNPSSPGSIAVCSNLFYQLYQILSNPSDPQDQAPKNMTKIDASDKKDNEQCYLLGHSLGELTCLSVNSLFSLKDLFDIANFRNKLMVTSTEKYLVAHNINRSNKFEMWALSSPRATDLPQEVQKLLNSPNLLSSSQNTISVANANSVKQCVVTGLVDDLESLRTELNLRFPRLRITELTNPYNIPFHNSTVLRPVQEPLYDYIWDILKKNGTHTLMELNHPIIANLDGNISYYIHHALDRFVKCSSRTVQFTMCYDTINSGTPVEIDKSICFGPGNVIYNLIRRNCPQVDTIEYTSLATIDAYHKAAEKNKD
ncbi:Mct1p [Saccharomyces cerevisiae YJM1401]|nr:Mct1p [Saccharomyces cerevisiae YJM1401]